jgi:CHAD domain-containing protein
MTRTEHPRPAGLTAGDVLRQRLEQQAAAVRAQEPLLRDDADDAIHDMRVALRRLRSALATYRPLLEPGSAEPLRDEMRWLGQELSPARDTEVIAERLEALVREQPAELVMGPVERRIDTELGSRAQQGRRRALEALESERYRRLLVDLDSFVAALPYVARAERPAAKETPRLLERDLRRLRRRARVADSATDPHARDIALHETRKAAKRLRYAAESAAPVFGRRARKLAKRAQRIQDVLGEHQDTVVARSTLRELGAQAYLAEENGFTFGRLHALEEARARKLLEQYPPALERLPGHRLARWLHR